MICALCKDREADKKNTHYLTDSIIRSCLNVDGSNDRDKGFYFDLSNNNPFVEFNFQRRTNIDKLESSIGRVVTDAEIEKAKKAPFTVDYVFCTRCENIFAEIEDNFIKTILPNFRNPDISKTPIVKVSDTKLLRLFFYLQIWRTSICESTFEIDIHISEQLRQIILNHKKIGSDLLNHFPLQITYLETLNGGEEYTTNIVGHSNDKNPNIIMFNDFIIQFYKSKQCINFLEFHGLNSKKTFRNYINWREYDFVVTIFTNQQRKKFLYNLLLKEKVKPSIEMYSIGFRELWLQMFNSFPTDETTKEFINYLINDDPSNMLNYSRESITNKIATFYEMKFK